MDLRMDKIKEKSIGRIYEVFKIFYLLLLFSICNIESD
jgi:hypothetical protein